MKFEIGDIVRFNLDTVYNKVNGYLAIITHIDSERLYPYTVRAIKCGYPMEHQCGNIKEDWVDKI